MIVLDASAAVALTMESADGSWVADWIGKHREELCAPHLIDAEVLSAVRGLALGGRIRRRDGEEMLAKFLDVRIVRYPHTPLLPAAWNLGRSMSGYDALYVALAGVLGVPLMTADRALARTAARHAAVLTPLRGTSGS